jgi:hypothetical protein
MKITNLNEAINSLKPADLVRLTYAFENGFSQVVFLDKGYFVAVHSNVPAIEINGAWKFGQTPQKG